MQVDSQPLLQALNSADVFAHSGKGAQVKLQLLAGRSLVPQESCPLLVQVYDLAAAAAWHLQGAPSYHLNDAACWLVEMGVVQLVLVQLVELDLMIATTAEKTAGKLRAELAHLLGWQTAVVLCVVVCLEREHFVGSAGM